MPDLSRCVYVNGQLYCWDREEKSFFQVELKPVHNAEILAGVIAAFMEDCPPQRAEKYYQWIAKEDSHIYRYDFEQKKWHRICDVDVKDLPASVRESVREDIEKGITDLTLLKSIEI